MEMRIRTLLSVIVSVMYCLPTKAQSELNESPYAMFGDESIMLDAEKTTVEDVCIVPISGDGGEILYAKFDFSNESAELYNGKDSVLDIIHFVPTARCSFLSIDPCAEKFYHVSPCAFCMGNPVNFVDPTGMKPDSLESAQLSSDVYEPTLGEGPGKWTCISKSNGGSFQWTIYSKGSGDALEYVLAFAGTNDVYDVMTDLYQGNGNINGNPSDFDCTEYGKAIDLAKAFVSFIGDKEGTFVGHSLGAALGTLAAMATQKQAMVFNPAAIHDNTIKTFGIDTQNHESLISAFIVRGELISYVNGVTDNARVYGNRIPIEPISGLSASNLHKIGTTINCMVK